MPDSLPSAAREILGFWFAPGMDERWFKKDPAFDDEVRANLLEHHERARAGAYRAWQEGPECCLALCLLLDQAPRNLFRDHPRAFAGDAAALAVAERAVERGFDAQLSQVRRMFLYLPFEHCEELAAQERCVQLISTLDEKPDWLDYAVRHRDVIARFGRFPHRNAVLGRESTAAERDFLTQPDSSF